MNVNMLNIDSLENQLVRNPELSFGRKFILGNRHSIESSMLMTCIHYVFGICSFVKPFKKLKPTLHIVVLEFGFFTPSIKIICQVN